MVKKVLSLMLVGAMTCSMLAGCGSTNQDELPKEGTEVEVSTENDGVGTTVEPSEDGMDGVATVLPEGTYVREITGGYLKEEQVGDGTSHYKLIYGGGEYTGTNTDCSLQFSSVQDIGSWVDENKDPGVWRLIDDNIWLTVVLWGGGMIPASNDGGLLTIDNTGFEDVANILSGMTAYEDTLEVRKADNYAAATVKVDRVDAGLSGYVTIIDDTSTSMRWIVQFLMLTESADLDMLKETAKSVAVGQGFDRNTLRVEANVSEKPYESTDGPRDNSGAANNTEAPAENAETPAENAETPADGAVENTETADDMNQPAEPGEGPEGSN